MTVRFIDYYTLASKLIFITFLMGVAIIFIRGLDEVADLVIAALVLALRWVSVILIKRRFMFSKYLLIILIARNAYRLIHVADDPKMNNLAIYLIIVQVILTIAAFLLITKKPQMVLETIRKKILNKTSSKSPQIVDLENNDDKL
jgi:hypothetical protein